MERELNQNILLQVGVKILLKDKNGKFLLLHRSGEKYPDVAGRWDIPGGRIEPGISLMENLKREVKEETNLELIGEPKLLAAQDILRVIGRHIVRLTYVGEAVGDVKLDRIENDGYEWRSLSDLKVTEDLDVYLKEIIENTHSSIL